jgi:superfamily II DNA or RNA helicase
MFTLRDYQTTLVEQGEAAMMDGEVPCLVSSTGSGKTIVLAELAKRALARGEQVVVICHRIEILSQIVASLQRHLGQRVVISQVTAGSRPRLDRQVVVGMVPTMCRRLKMLEQLKGCTLLADECHHGPSVTWTKTIQAISPRRMLGLTATPVRPDGKGLGDSGLFHRLILGPEPAELMAAGALARYRMFAAPHAVSVDGLKKRCGDYSVSDLEKRVVAINGSIVSDWRRFNPKELSTISVGVSVEHCHQVAEMYRDKGVTAAAVDGTTPKTERANIFSDFKAGRITVLCACQVVDEGLDTPSATCLQLLRPTASLRLYRQLIGRVLRPKPDGCEALIIDHTPTWRLLPPPDAEINWQLNAEVQEPREKREQIINAETGEVEQGEPVETEVQETGAKLVEITPDLLAQAHPVIARRLLNERCRSEVEQRVPDLRRWLNYLDVLEDETLKLLEPALGLQAGWAQGQMMLRMLLSPGQRLAATKRLQRSWGGV